MNQSVTCSAPLRAKARPWGWFHLTALVLLSNSSTIHSLPEKQFRLRKTVEF